MGFRKIKFLKSVDRRTYIKGSFIGKYRGEFDKTKSDSFSNNEEYYDIDVYEGELVNFKIERDNPSEINEKKHAEFQSEVHFLQKQFDNIISKPVTPLVDDFDVFKFKIVEPKIKNVKIEKVIKDDRQTFGTFTCTVFGYIVDTIEVEEEIDVEVCDQCDKLVSNCICQTRGGGEIIEEVKNCNNCKKPLIDCVCPPSPPDRPINTKTNWGCLDIVKWLFFIMLIIG
jgi:hypothetical protein